MHLEALDALQYLAPADSASFKAEISDASPQKLFISII